jgi:hypothetical protein
MPEHLLDNLDVFYGELTPARAKVYARLEGLESTAGLSLSGIVRGPRCYYSTTLPATFRLDDAGPGPSLLAKALVPDPCYWSPETPNIYDVTVELRKGSDIIASEVRQIGFKPLGMSGRFFTWEGKPWVLRGVTAKPSTELNLNEWRNNSAALVGSGISDEDLQAASMKGVLCFCLGRVDCSESESLIEAKRFAKYPAVAIANVCLPTQNVQRMMPNVITTFKSMLSGEAKLITEGVPVYRPYLPKERAERMTLVKVPLIVCRPEESALSVAEARSACDKLQAELAPVDQFAGYVV